MNLRRILTTVRTALRVTIARIDARLNPPEPIDAEQRRVDPEQAADLARKLERRVRIAGTRPWNYSRRSPLVIPESLKYYESIHGTEATLRMLTARAQQRERNR
jgi:hypothetical protein